MAVKTKSTIAPERPVKSPSESRVYSFDFSRKLAGGETLLEPTVTYDPSSDLTLVIGPPAVSGSQVQVRISGGTSNTIYSVSCLVETSAGNTLECDGYLTVALD